MVLTGRLKLLMVAAAAVAVYVVMSAPKDPAESTAASSGAASHAATGSQGAGASAQSGGNRASGRNVSSAGSEDAARMLAQLSNRVTDDQSAGALFKAQSWYTPPPPPPPAPVVAAAPPPAPTAPPVPFAIMGSYARPGDAKVYFLTRGERVFDVRVGDTIDNTYSVDGEANGQLLLTYKPLGIQQTLPIGGS